MKLVYVYDTYSGVLLGQYTTVNRKTIYYIGYDTLIQRIKTGEPFRGNMDKARMIIPGRGCPYWFDRQTSLLKIIGRDT